MVAGHELTGRDLAQLRFLFCAKCSRRSTTCSESATRRRICWRRWLAFNNSRPATNLRVGHRHGGHKCSGVVMGRRTYNFLRRRNFTNLAKIHHNHAVTDCAHHTQIVRDKQQRKSVALLHVLNDVKYLRLNAHVKGRHRLITHQQLGL